MGCIHNTTKILKAAIIDLYSGVVNYRSGWRIPAQKRYGWGMTAYVASKGIKDQLHRQLDKVNTSKIKNQKSEGEK